MAHNNVMMEIMPLAMDAPTVSLNAVMENWIEKKEKNAMMEIQLMETDVQHHVKDRIILYAQEQDLPDAMQLG